MILEDDSIDRIRPVSCASLTGTHEAVQVTGLNRIAVIGWVVKVGGRANISRDGILVWGQPGDRARTAFNGDWVVCLYGNFMVVPAAIFALAFKEVTVTPVRRRRRSLEGVA